VVCISDKGDLLLVLKRSLASSGMSSWDYSYVALTLPWDCGVLSGLNRQVNTRSFYHYRMPLDLLLQESILHEMSLLGTAGSMSSELRGVLGNHRCPS